MRKIGMLKRIFGAAIVLVMLAVSIIGVIPVSAAPADCYWVGDGGNWSDDANHWAIVSGGAPGAGNLPNGSSNVHFDANSFTVSGQTVYQDIAGGGANCFDMDWTGVTNNPTFSSPGARYLNIYGDITLSANMTVTGVQNWEFEGAADKTLTTNGCNIGINTLTMLHSGGNHQVTLLDDFTGSCRILHRYGTFDSNGFNIVCGSFDDGNYTNTTVLTITGSTVTCTAWSFNPTNLTVNAGGSTIICSGNFNGAGFTYNNVELNGTVHTISGSNTFNDLKFNRSGVQTITFTDGTTQTVNTLTRDAGTSIKTLQGSGVGGWTIDNVSGAEIDIDNISVSYSTAATNDINAYKLSVNGGNNTNWNFPFTPVTNLATGIGMTGFNTTATLNGQISDLGGDYPVTLILEWGYTTAYGNIALNTTTSTVPTSVSATITQFDPEQTVHFRLRAVNLLGTTSGADQTIPFTVPAWYTLIHSLFPVAVAAVILVGVLVVMGNPLAAFLSAMTGLVGYYVILAMVSPNWV